MRCKVRPYEESDLQEVYAVTMTSRESIGKWMDWALAVEVPADTRAWITCCRSEWAKTSYEHLIVDSDSGKILGACGLNSLNATDGVANLGYWVAVEHRGQGIAVEAVRLLCEFAFAELGLNRVEIVVADGNTASRRVAEKASAIYEGPQRNRLVVSGRPRTAHMYALLPE